MLLSFALTAQQLMVAYALHELYHAVNKSYVSRLLQQKVHLSEVTSFSGSSLSLGTSPNQSSDGFQYPALKNGLGYSLSPICSVPRNVCG